MEHTETLFLLRVQKALLWEQKHDEGDRLNYSQV